MNDLSRRLFIKNSALYAVSVYSFGFVSCSKDNGMMAAVGDCKTTSDILGPFYRANAPFRSDLTFPNQKGTKLVIKGRVYSQDCETLLKDAIVDIWQASDDGDYDNTTDDFLHRGRYTVDEDGEYQFKTIIPGKYLNGDTFRPSHVHFRVTAAQHKELVSQIYFKDDPYIESDPWASDPEAKMRILPLEDLDGVKTVTFDIYLIK